MKKMLKVLLCQQNFTVGAIEANAIKIKSLIKANQTAHDLIIFPELSLTGYPPEDLLFRSALYERVNKALEAIAQITNTCHVVVGHPVCINGQLFNAASIFYDGRCIQQYYKQVLPNQGVFDEKRYFTAGPATACLFSINTYQIGLCICEDIWHEEPVQQIIDAGADCVVCINASPYDYQKHTHRLELLERQAKKGVDIIYVNLVGGQDDLVFDGQSLVFNHQGVLCAQLPSFTESNTSITITPQHINAPITPALDQTASIYNALVLGTRDYIKKHGFSGALLGLSGGIDSALTLAIAVDALGTDHVHAVLMPSRYTAEMSLIDAKQQATTLGVKSTVLSIEYAFEAILATLAEPFQGLPKNITEENLQARIRGMLLMALSNKTGNIVLTTSNKSESAVGYTTLYGDMAGGFCVLKDVLKTQVYALAAYRNSLSQVIPERVITRAPSAELAENQTDQDSLPPYPLLDAIIQAYVEHNQDAEAIILQGLPAEIVNNVIGLIKRNEHKRRQAPPGPKVSPRAFSRDWRYPITSEY